MARLVRHKIDMDDVVRAVREWANTVAMLAKLEERKGGPKKGPAGEHTGLYAQLVAAVKQAGYEHEGHLWLDLPNEVEGYVQLKYERRAPQAVLNAERTMAFLRRKRLMKEVVREVVVQEIDEDALVALAFGSKKVKPRITEEELQSLYDTGDETWAFKPLKR